MRPCGGLVAVISAPRRWAAAAVLVGVGWLVSPQPVPVYDGVQAPDEPYRYVAPPAGAKATSPATTATAKTPVVGGVGTNGLSVQTGEQGPQASLFLPPRGLAATSGTIVVTVTPQAPDRQPTGAVIDGNVYRFAITDPAGPVTLTAQGAIATLFLRATTTRQPGPVMQFRTGPGAAWKAVKTSRGGQDIYVSSFAGPGDYALAFSPEAKGSGTPVLPYVALGAGALVVVVVVVVRLRAKPE
jgi:hypothetical protein